MPQLLQVIGIIVFFVLSLFVPSHAQQERVTITTYYPSPYGVYKVLRLYPTNDITPNAPCTNPGEIAYHLGTQTIYVCSGSPTSRWLIAPGQQGFWAASRIDTNDIYNTNSLDVGVGTTNPTFKLHVVSSANYNNDAVGAFAISDSSIIAKKMYMGYDRTRDYSFIGSVYSGVENKNLILEPVRYVGIGTTNPRAKLDVEGGVIVRGTGAGIPLDVYCTSANICAYVEGAQGGYFHFQLQNLSSGEDYGNIVAYDRDGGLADITINALSSGSPRLGVGRRPDATFDAGGDALLGIDNVSSAGPGERGRIRMDEGYFDPGAGSPDEDALIIEKTDDDTTVEGGIVFGFATSMSNNTNPPSPNWATQHRAVMTIRGNGRVGIGTINPSRILTIVQNSITDPIADAWTTYSSSRYKKDIQPITNALEKTMKLRGVTFKWRESDTPGIGLIAEEVGEVIPEVVSYEANQKDANGLSYDHLVGLLVEAIKEQQKEIDYLKKEIRAIEKQL